MSDINFYFESAKGTTAPKFDLDISNVSDIDTLKRLVATNFGIVQAEGVSFHNGDATVSDISELQSSKAGISIKVDGHAVREVPHPSGLPFFSNYFEVFPDHLGNNQRLFTRLGPIFETKTMGSVVCQTNDSELAQIVFAESEFFSKEITPAHPLYPIKNQKAGVFLGDTSNPDWKIVHELLPPALGPKAVRHYAPRMNARVNEAFPVFDELEKKN